MTDIRDERIVKFTPNEVSELADFLRTFEASATAVRLLGKINLRATYAMIDAEDSGDEAEDTSMSGIPVPAPLSPLEREVLARIAALEKSTFDGYVKPELNTFGVARLLDVQGLVVKHPGAGINLYRTTEAGRTALEYGIPADEPSA